MTSPKVLWELGGSAVITTKSVLHFLVLQKLLGKYGHLFTYMICLSKQS